MPCYIVTSFLVFTGLGLITFELEAVIIGTSILGCGAAGLGLVLGTVDPV